MLFHYEITLRAGRQHWTFKCTTIVEAFRAIDETVSSLGLSISTDDMMQYMETLAAMAHCDFVMDSEYRCFMIRKAEGEV